MAGEDGEAILTAGPREDAAEPASSLPGTQVAAPRIVGSRQPGSRGVLTGILLTTALLAVLQTQLFVVGLVVGAVYAIGSVGLTMSWKILGFPNLAHSVLMVIAAYIAMFAHRGLISGTGASFDDVEMPFNFSALPGADASPFGLSFGYGFLLALVVATAVGVAAAHLIDALVFRRLRNRRRTADVFTLVIASFGVAYVVTGVIAVGWGSRSRSLTSGVTPARRFFGDILLKPDHLFVLVACVAIAVMVHFLLYRSQLGRLMRATADNRDLARVSGIDVENVIRKTWTIVGSTTAASGVLLALVSPISPEAGLSLLLPLFAATILGGIGSPSGALIGGLFVGIVQEVSVAYMDGGYKVGMSFALIVIVLLLKPHGLYGVQVGRP